MLVPTSPNDPAAPANRKAWEVLREWEKPFLTAFSDSDPITAGADRALRERVPGARDREHATVHGGHFLQEDSGAELAAIVVRFLHETGARAARRRR